MDDTKALYQIVFQTANRFLRQAKLFSIEELNEHNEPTYEELAVFARKIAAIIGQLANLGGCDETRIALNARQAALLMETMAEAIKDQNSEALDDAASKLEAMTFI
ncbi:hypothetical protein [Shewanella zhangzhouensis]|uniref:hypothetical protein n=1 Tax=Shewanella zhangzhouensis TaxID=2864213 RepID=UPI001C655C61|nr:hypothetical protein [Shewanella zhangzhouensis]QYK04916.1 hypothetical protein K0H63_18020 [Shewanella zhangzhouensis]